MKNLKVIRKKVLVDGELIEVELTQDGWKDVPGEFYDVLPSGKFVRRNSPHSLKYLKDFGKPELNKIIVLENGTKCQWRAHEDGTLILVQLMSITRSQTFVTLSPNDPSRHGSHKGSGSK